MKRFIPLALALVLVWLAVSSFNDVMASKVNALYAPNFGNELNQQKNLGTVLQKAALDRGDSIPVFGSSELSETYREFHPVTFFQGKYQGIQYNLIGRGHSQSLIHLLNLGALGDTLKDEKVVIIISPQWFTKTGLTSDNFMSNFSQQQYLAFMTNDSIDQGIKTDVTRRVGSLLGPEVQTEIKAHAHLSAGNTAYGQILLGILKPYYELKTTLLTTKDLYQSYKLFAGKPLQPVHSSANGADVVQERVNGLKIDWEAERKRAIKLGEEQSSNNDYRIENGYFDQYIRKTLSEYKRYLKGQSYLESPEYEDLELMLRLCREQGIKPLFISIPVNGPWYDYGGFPKEDRQAYYEKVRKLITSYGFELADFADHEYDAYFLKDTMHLGWKGWVDVNEAILSYYK